MTAKPVQRDALLQVLLEASRQPMSGCELYVVNLALTNPNAVFVYEVWRSEADHDASLQLERV
ncbi:MAG TPA: antibiotic biosynthesis monooxygenase family protein, partial [Terriglobales bacterium]|nr:antibiotic biosynthesis monooxygenase family protein [Terriglobales bacterium]